MKNLLFLLVIVLFFNIAGIANGAGFRDLNWGDNLSDIEGMKHLGTDPGYAGGIELYVRPKDVLKMGTAELDMIVYKFWRNKLFGVTILVTDLANYAALKEATQKKFGKGWKYPYMEYYMWLGPPTRLHLEYCKITGRGRLALYSSDLVQQAEAYSEKHLLSK